MADVWNPASGEPYWEAAKDVLDTGAWRTPGINASAEGSDNKAVDDGYVIYGGIFDRSATEVTKEAYEKALKQNPALIKLSEALGLLRPSAERKSESGPVGDFFARVGFILIGLIFITISLVMISRPVQEGLVEGIKEGLEG